MDGLIDLSSVDTQPLVVQVWNGTTNVTINAGVQLLRLTITPAATRTITFPSAATIGAGKSIFLDLQTQALASKCTLTPLGNDTLNNVATTYDITGPSSVIVYSDGVSNLSFGFTNGAVVSSSFPYAVFPYKTISLGSSVNGEATYVTVTNTGGAGTTTLCIDGGGNTNSSNSGQITGAKGIMMPNNRWIGFVNSAAGSLFINSALNCGFYLSATGLIEVNTGTAISGTSNAASLKALAFMPAGTATTCTGATIGTGSKSHAGFVTATTTGVSTIVITFPVTAPTGWNVMATNNTAVANAISQTTNTTTTATISGTTTSGDVVSYIAFPY